MIGAHVHTVTRRGCFIVTCEPATRTIEAKIQRGEVVPINAYSFTPLFRWPMVGEQWVIREENGSWFLDSIWEEQEPRNQEEGKAQIELDLGFRGRLRPIWKEA